jgi:hypothetical protein
MLQSVPFKTQTTTNYTASYSTKVKPEAGRPTSPVTLETRSPWLLGRWSRDLRGSCAGANMLHSLAERVPSRTLLRIEIMWCCFVKHLSVRILSRKYRARQHCANISVHSKCLSVTSERGATERMKLGRTDFRQCIRMRLQEFRHCHRFHHFMCKYLHNTRVRT